MSKAADPMVAMASRMATYLERYVQEVRGDMGRLIDSELRSAPRRLLEGDATAARRLRGAGEPEHAADRHRVVGTDRNAEANALAPKLPEGTHPIFPDRKMVADIVYNARSGAGNFGIGGAGRAEADAAGLAWVGTDARALPYNDTHRLVSSDGLRQYRPPQQKPAGRGIQANYEWRSHSGRHWESNAHLDIEEQK